MDLAARGVPVGAVKDTGRIKMLERFHLEAGRKKHVAERVKRVEHLVIVRPGPFPPTRTHSMYVGSGWKPSGTATLR